MRSIMLIYTRPDCVWCHRAKNLLTSYGLDYLEVHMDTEEKRAHFKKTIADTFPQIYDNTEGGNLIGGYLDLEKWIETNYL